MQEYKLSYIHVVGFSNNFLAAKDIQNITSHNLFITIFILIHISFNYSF